MNMFRWQFQSIQLLFVACLLDFDGAVSDMNYMKFSIRKLATQAAGPPLCLCRGSIAIGFHCGRDGRLHASTRAYARVRTSTLEYARVRSSTHE